VQDLAVQLLARASRQLAMLALHEEGSPSRRHDLRIGGAENIAAQPEFQTADRLRALVSLLAQPAPLTRALDTFAASGSARITIGRELGDGAMRACSMVGTGIASNRLRGSLGVLGPVRMPYPRLLSLVSYVGERLAEFA
jgi:heat-inducible transcriptional repressor